MRKSGYVALLGCPNVGKSTLMNLLIGQKIAITSNRPQTTRKKIETVYTDERGQIIFLDTPGLHRSNTRLGEYMDTVALETLNDADLIILLISPDVKENDFYLKVTDKLKSAAEHGKKIILAVNKADLFKSKAEADSLIKSYKTRLKIADAVCVSALTGENTGKLKDIIFGLLPEGPMYYDEDTVTNIPVREIAAELIREQILKRIRDEIPHGVAVNITRFSFRQNGLVDIEADIVCEKDSHKGIIIGKGGAMLKAVGSAARAEIERELETRVNLKLFVKVRKNWRDNDTFLRSYGFDQRKI